MTDSGNEVHPTMNATDIAKLETEATALRTKMIEALTAGDDSTTRKLSTELATVNKSITNGQAEAQADSRTAFMADAHDALNGFEIDGMTLAVNFSISTEGAQQYSIVYTPTDARIADIKAAIDVLDRPTTATRWAYGRDEEGHQSFDFGGKAKRASTGTNGNGTRTTGWTKDGNEVALGDAFDAIATAKDKSDLAALNGDGSKQYALKTKVVKAGGYAKA